MLRFSTLTAPVADGADVVHRGDHGTAHHPRRLPGEGWVYDVRVQRLDQPGAIHETRRAVPARELSTVCDHCGAPTRGHTVYCSVTCYASASSLPDSVCTLLGD